MTSNWPDAEPNNYDNLEIDEALVAEATQFSNRTKTVPTGDYQIQGHPFDLEPDTRDPGQYKRAVPGRMTGRVRFDIYALDNPTQKLATVFADMSPEPHKIQTANGSFLDSASQLWLQAAKVFGVKKHGEVREALGKYPVKGYIKEQYKLDGKYVSPVTESDRVALIEKGAQPYLDLRTIKPLV